MIALALHLYSAAHAAETLVPVSPPSDGVGVWLFVFLAFVLLLVGGGIAYTIYVRGKPGLQLGEAELEKIAAFIDRRHEAPPVVAPYTVDGFVFADQQAMDSYISAKAIVAAAKPKEA